MFTKHSLSVILLFVFAIAAHAQQVKRKGVRPIQVNHNTRTTKVQFTINQFDGKWQEVRRSRIKNDSAVAFTDTLLMNFTAGSNVETRTTVPMSIAVQGTADIDEDNILTAGTDSYTIKSVAADDVVLDDDDFSHQFKKVDYFTCEHPINKPVAQQ